DLPAAVGGEGLERLLIGGHGVLVPEPEGQGGLAVLAGAPAVVAGGGARGRGGQQTGGGEGGKEGAALEHGGPSEVRGSGAGGEAIVPRPRADRRRGRRIEIWSRAARWSWAAVGRCCHGPGAVGAPT